MAAIVLEAPAAEPITLAQAKEHLRVVDPDEDATIQGLIAAARAMAEKRTGRALMPRKLRIGVDGFGRCMAIPHPPLISIDQVRYIDADGVEQTMASSDYALNPYVEPAVLDAPYGGSWPSTRYQAGAVVIDYTAGYAAGVPPNLVQWMLLAIGALYENRQSVIVGTGAAALPDDFMQLLIQPEMVYL